LYLEENNLTGSVPAEFKNLTKLEKLEFDNKLCDYTEKEVKKSLNICGNITSKRFLKSETAIYSIRYVLVIYCIFIIYYYFRKNSFEKEKKNLKNTYNNTDYENRIIEKEKKFKKLGRCVSIITCILLIILVAFPFFYYYSLQ
jgi:uncharacterized membrane protein